MPKINLDYITTGFREALDVMIEFAAGSREYKWAIVGAMRFFQDLNLRNPQEAMNARERALINVIALHHDYRGSYSGNTELEKAVRKLGGWGAIEKEVNNYLERAFGEGTVIDLADESPNRHHSDIRGELRADNDFLAGEDPPPMEILEGMGYEPPEAPINFNDDVYKMGENTRDNVYQVVDDALGENLYEQAEISFREPPSNNEIEVSARERGEF